MKSGLINKTSPYIDVVELLSGTWNEYDDHEFHIVVTPFFTVISGALDEGSHALPFQVYMPVAATVYHGDGTVSACLVKPGDSAVSISKAGLFQLMLFGDRARVK